MLDDSASDKSDQLCGTDQEDLNSAMNDSKSTIMSKSSELWSELYEAERPIDVETSVINILRVIKSRQQIFVVLPKKVNILWN